MSEQQSWREDDADYGTALGTGASEEQEVDVLLTEGTRQTGSASVVDVPRVTGEAVTPDEVLAEDDTDETIQE